MRTVIENQQHAVTFIQRRSVGLTIIMPSFFRGNTMRRKGAYTVEVSAAVGHLSSSSGHKSSSIFDIVWKYRARNIARSTLEEKLLFQLQRMPPNMADGLVPFGSQDGQKL